MHFAYSSPDLYTVPRQRELFLGLLKFESVNLTPAVAVSPFYLFLYESPPWILPILPRGPDRLFIAGNFGTDYTRF